jgi:hypothetical protein
MLKSSLDAINFPNPVLSEYHIRTCRVLRHKVELGPMSASRTIYIDRALVLTLGAAVVAQRLGFDGSTLIDRAAA